MHNPGAENAPCMPGKSVRRKGLSESNSTEYKAIVEKLGPKLKCVHQQYKSMNTKFPVSIC